MRGLVLAAPASGGGKTTVTCALLRALTRRGINPCAFKCGPDYIDPMFHRGVLGVDSHNLDLFLSDEEGVRALFTQCTQGHEMAVCEGAMGLYDGLGGTTDRASAWHVAQVLNLPVVLVVRPKGASLTLAAQIRGLMDFRPNSHIAGIILNDCKEMLARSLAPMLERETGLPVLGFLPHLEEGEVQSRHLGLYTAGEVENLSQRVDRLAQALEAHVDLDRLLELCAAPEESTGSAPVWERRGAVPIAVARDEAFCFLYAETIEALQRAGAQIQWFSPIHDRELPAQAGGLYLPGGYPELYAKALSKNHTMRGSIRAAVAGGLPTVAECGGFLYLGQSLRCEDGACWPMAGVLPGAGFPAGKLVRFGYANLTARRNSLLFRAGETVPVHEFHYWDSTDNGTDLQAVKPMTGRSWACGFVNETLYAAFPHLYFGGPTKLADRFVDGARRYWEENTHETGEHSAADRP